MNFLKLKKNKLPSPKSMRQPIFRVERFWFSSLVIALLVLLVAGLMGLDLAYDQYSESYKESGTLEGNSDLVNTKRLNSTIEIRQEFIDREFTIPKDPSQ